MRRRESRRGLAYMEAANSVKLGDEVVVPDPSFEPYVSVPLLMGAVPRLSPLVDYTVDLDDVVLRVTERAKAIFFCSPHNSAPTIVRRGPLLRFLDALGPDPPLV